MNETTYHGGCAANVNVTSLACRLVIKREMGVSAYNVGHAANGLEANGKVVESRVLLNYFVVIAQLSEEAKPG